MQNDKDSPKSGSKFGDSPNPPDLKAVFDVKVPKYLKHKEVYARVILNGREIHLGVYGSPESVAAYERTIAEWIQVGKKTPRPKRLATAKKERDALGLEGVLTVTELAVKYFEFAQTYYLKNGEPTTEVEGIRYALKMLRKYYGESPIDEFGPTALKTIRSEFIRMEWARSTINKQISRIMRMFRWGVSESLVKTDTLIGLQSVPGLKAGRSQAREPEQIRPVSESDVESVRPFVSPVVMAMIDIQRLTGMRPTEVCKLRTSDIIQTDAIWEYRPPQHKTIHHGKKRFVFFGPLAQSVLKPWLRPQQPDAYLFSPELADSIRKAKARANRKTKVQPTQVDRAKAKPLKKPGVVYNTRSYNHAISYASERAGTGHWHPNQLRHLAATNIRREFGIETARAVLGHSTVSMTEVYAEMDATKARDAMAKSG